jgi:hypothetical protein
MAAASATSRSGTRCGSRSTNAVYYENPDLDRLSAEAGLRPDIDWRHFVAYASFLKVAFIWVQARRGRDRAVTALGMIGFVAAFLAHAECVALNDEVFVNPQAAESVKGG